MLYERTEYGDQPYAIVQFDRWNKSATTEMRSHLENGKSVDILALGQRAYMVDYQMRNFLKEQEEKERRRIRKQREEEKRLKKQKEDEERRIRKQREEERLKKQREEEQQRRNREAAEMFEMENNKYINDAPILNELEIDYGDEETKFFKFNTKTGNMDYKGRQYVIYT